MPNYVPIEHFLDFADDTPIIDVRAPIEFSKAHIPGAKNVPLFDDKQRARVGKCYRNDGRDKAILLGLNLIGPRMRELAESLISAAVDRKIKIHCWRGGMRSRSVAWLAELVDLDVSVLQGGYKSYRRQVLKSFKQPLKLFVVSGLTGAGKSIQIELLANAGEQVIDLEKLANHRGSTFGGLGLNNQPSVEQFENRLSALIAGFDMSRRIWVEDESRNVGAIKLPHHFFAQLRAAPAIFMDVAKATRNELIQNQYGSSSEDELIDATLRIRKRLGGQNAKRATEHIVDGKIEAAVDVLLEYYDRLYLSNKERLRRDFYADLAVANPESVETTEQLIEMADKAASFITS